MEIRRATEQDVSEITTIYNEGIEDRIATLETETKTDKYVMEWLFQRDKRYSVIVLEENSQTVGWASINPYSHRCAYKGVGELSIYIYKERVSWERLRQKVTYFFRKYRRTERLLQIYFVYISF